MLGIFSNDSSNVSETSDTDPRESSGCEHHHWADEPNHLGEYSVHDARRYWGGVVLAVSDLDDDNVLYVLVEEVEYKCQHSGCRETKEEDTVVAELTKKQAREEYPIREYKTEIQAFVEAGAFDDD